MSKVGLKDIKKAQEVLKSVIRRTQLIESKHFSSITNGRVFLKPENLQETGSFKLRGAYNKIFNLSEEEKAAGVIASSAGNHAQGVALSATKAGIKSTIVMPEIAPVSKVTATKNYGAKVVLHGSVYDEAYEKACEIQRETKATFIHPFDDPYVIAGQGTIGLEILADLPEIDVVLVPIGGGGLAAGISKAIKSINPEIKVIGVEASNAASMKAALGSGSVHDINTKPTIADGIAVRRAGKLTFDIIKENVDEVVSVSEDDLARAFLALVEKEKMISEGAGAAALAALYNSNLDLEGKTIVSIISGGNVDINLMERIINKALLIESRRFNLRIKMKDNYGELEKLLKIISGLSANILATGQSMYRSFLGVTEQEVNFTLETKDYNHAMEIKDTLIREGYQIII